MLRRAAELVSVRILHMNNRAKITLFVLMMTAFISGCQSSKIHLTLTEQTKAESLEPIKTYAARIPVKIQVVNFVVNSAKSAAGNVNEVELKRYYELAAANRLQSTIGQRHVFSEVSRATRADPSSADFIVTGEYDYSSEARGFSFLASQINPIFRTHSIDVKGIMHVHVVAAKTGGVVHDKVYVEAYSASSGATEKLSGPSVLRTAHLATISADIETAVQATIRKEP